MVESVNFVMETKITVGLLHFFEIFGNLDIFFGPCMNMRNHKIPVVKLV